MSSWDTVATVKFETKRSGDMTSHFTLYTLHFTLYTLQFLHQLLASSAVFLSESKLCATDGDENHV